MLMRWYCEMFEENWMYFWGFSLLIGDLCAYDVIWKLVLVTFLVFSYWSFYGSDEFFTTNTDFENITSNILLNHQTLVYSFKFSPHEKINNSKRPQIPSSAASSHFYHRSVIAVFMHLLLPKRLRFRWRKPGMLLMILMGVVGTAFYSFQQEC